MKFRNPSSTDALPWVLQNCAMVTSSVRAGSFSSLGSFALGRVGEVRGSKRLERYRRLFQLRGEGDERRGVMRRAMKEAAERTSGRVGGGENESDDGFATEDGGVE